MKCEVCGKSHGIRDTTIIKANGREIVLRLCADCRLLLAGRSGG